METLCYTVKCPFVCPQFLPLLQQRGWAQIKSYFSPHKTHPRRTLYKPGLTGEPAIAIPCYIHGCHWVAVARREIHGRVLFLYSDDLNDNYTERIVKQQLEQTCEEFYLADAEWINCKSITYAPHFNECGPRTALALTILMTHPAPHINMLINFMHPNLSQILRTWMASVLLSGEVYLPPLDHSTLTQQIEMSSKSDPASLIKWTSPFSTTNYQDNNGILTQSQQKSSLEQQHATSDALYNTRSPIIITSPIERNAPSYSVHLSSSHQILPRPHPTTTIYKQNKKKSPKCTSVVPTAHKLLSNSPHHIKQGNETKKTLKSDIANMKPRQTIYIKKKPEALPVLRDQSQQKITDFFPTSTPYTHRKDQDGLLQPNLDLTSTEATNHPSLSQSLPNKVTPSDLLPLDPTIWGHSLEAIDTTTTIRVLLQNPNGIHPHQSNQVL